MEEINNHQADKLQGAKVITKLKGRVRDSSRRQLAMVRWSIVA